MNDVNREGTNGEPPPPPFLCAIVSRNQVEQKNIRIEEILVELGSDETFFKPKWLDVEQPEEVFNVRY